MPASPAGYSINPVPPNSTANLPPTPLPTPAPARCDTRGKSRPIGHSALRDFELTYVGLGAAADITRLLSNVRFGSCVSSTHVAGTPKADICDSADRPKLT